MKKFKNLLKFYQNARKFERKLTDFVRLNCKKWQRAAHPFATDTRKTYQTRRGDHNVFKENLSARHTIVRNVAHRRTFVCCPKA